MRKIREILRVRYGLGQTMRKVAMAAGVGPTTVSDVLGRAQKAGLGWPLPDDLDDVALEAMLYPRTAARVSKAPTPDWSQVHVEMKRRGVTRELLWQEYRARHPEGFGYSQYCELYSAWLAKSRISMRQIHRAGEKLFVDFAGSTISVVDPTTGEKREAQLFVATWGASNYTYVRAVWSQDLPSWIQCHVDAFNTFGCVPRVVVIDNLKSGVTRPCRYDPDINPTYAELARHYGTCVVPARVAHPKDKAKVEFAVRLATRWIVAALRNRAFFSLGELNDAIEELSERLNMRPFQKMPGSRRASFDELDRPSALSLPSAPYVYAEIVAARVNIDYHIAVDEHFYSVPHQLRGEKVTARLTSTIVEIFHRDRRIWTHARSYTRWTHTTVVAHMPKAHQKHLEWTPTRIISWAEAIGPSVSAFCAEVLRSLPHPEQGFRRCLGIIRLAERFGKERAEAACKRAMAFGTYRYRDVKSILEKGLDRNAANPLLVAAPIAHENIRGAAYYAVPNEAAR